jgi:predicted phage tail protein
MKRDDLIAISGAGGGGGCFRAGTQIQLQHGKTIAIELLKTGDEVMAFDEEGFLHVAKVAAVHYHADPQPLLCVKYWRGEMQGITPNHWVLNQYENFAEMGRLTPHDALIDGMGHLRPIIGAELIGYEPVWNLTVETYHTFIADGIRVHNGGHRDRYPVVSGAGGGGKGNGGATEAPDSLQSNAMITLLDLLGEGQIGGLVNGGQSIYFNDTPFQNSDGSYNFFGTNSNGSYNTNGITWASRNGSQGQTPMGGFSDVETPFDVNVQIKYAMPYTLTVQNPEADTVRMVVSLPSLTTTDSNSGDISGGTVQFKFQLSTNGGAFVDATSTLTISGKSSSTYQAQYLIPITPGANCMIRMVRLTADSASSFVCNDTWLNSYYEIISQQLSYPNSALVGVRINAAQFNSIPTRSYDVYGLVIQIPSNYNPTTRQYTGVWNGAFTTGASSNPAWVLYDLLTNSRYGLGQYLSASQIDVATLYAIGQYCDGMVPDGFGGTEPRFQINTAIQSRAEAYKVISDICSVFRGMAFWNGNSVSFMQDAPGSASFIFSQANVVDGLFAYTSTARKDRHSVVNVTWNDPAQNYKQQIEYVENRTLIQQFGVRQLDVVAFGTTSRGQAHRVGQWILYTEQYETDAITFDVGIEAAMVLPGELVWIHDENRAGRRMGGRITSATTTSAALDAPVTITQVPATLSIRQPDGSYADVTLDQGVGTWSNVSWVGYGALTQTPMPNTVWLVMEADLEPMLARVVSIKQKSTKADQFTIVAVQSNQSKYGYIEEGYTLVQPNTTVLSPNFVSAVSELQAISSTYLASVGHLGYKMHVSWSSNCSQFTVSYRMAGSVTTNWTTINTTSPSCDITGLTPGAYEVSVYSTNPLGVNSATSTVNCAVAVKTTPPADVTGLTCSTTPNGILLTWADNTDFDLAGYEVRRGTSWGASTVLTTGFSGTSFTDPTIAAAGTYYYMVRAINLEGYYSADVTTATCVIPVPQDVQNFAYIQSGNTLNFSWSANPESTLMGYELRSGASWATGQFIAQVNTTNYTMPAGASQTLTVWIKAVDMPGIYSADPMPLTVNVVAANNTTTIYTSDQAAVNFPGVLHALQASGGALLSTAANIASEYDFEINLGTTYRAQNTLQCSVNAISTLATSLTWANINSTWGNLPVGEQWAPTLSNSSTNASMFVAINAVNPVTQIDGVRMNGNLTSLNNVIATTSGTITYQPGRFSQGLMVADAQYVSWSIGLPATMSMSLWICPSQQIDATYFTLVGSGYSLSVIYDLTNSEFALVDQLGNRVNVPFTYATGDSILISVAQNSTTRKLYVGKWDGSNTQWNSAQMAPLGAFSSIQLY